MSLARERLEAEIKAIHTKKREALKNPTDRPAPRLRPADAATLVVLDHSGREPKVLMGRRNASVRFMPNKFVFPGGRIDAADRAMPVAGILESRVEARLMAGSPGISAARCRALALASIRETFEETGLMIGTKDHGGPDSTPDGSWSAFATHGVMPDLEGLRYLARAITPPGRTRRYDTRFFVVDSSFIVHRVERQAMPDDELTEIGWIPLGKAKELDVPAITHIILDELDARLQAGIELDLPVPFYRQRYGTFVRELV